MLCTLTVSLSTDTSSEGLYPSLFMSALSGQSDRTLSLCWEQHCKLLPGVQGIHASQVAMWNVEEVSELYLHVHSFIQLSFRSSTSLCCRSSCLSRTWLDVKTRLVSSKTRWEHRMVVPPICLCQVCSWRAPLYSHFSPDDWWGSFAAAHSDRHCEDHEHQTRPRPQDLQRHSHVQDHRRRTQVIPPQLTGTKCVCVCVWRGGGAADHHVPNSFCCRVKTLNTFFF